MSREDNQIKDYLAQLSRNIEALTAQTDEYPRELNDIEQWLKNQLEKIRLHRVSADSSIFAAHKEENERYDGIIIFSNKLKVLHFVAPRNYFYGPAFSSTANLSMSDFLFEDDLKKIAEIISSADNFPLNAKCELTFKTGPGSSINGIITLMSTGINECNDNFTALLSFPGNPEQLFTTYQATILDNLPGMDVYLFDREYRFIIAGGREKKRHGHANDYYIGKTFFDVLDKKSQRSLFPFYSKALSGIHTEGEVRFGDQVYYIVARPINETGNQPIAGLLIAQNVTSDKLLEQQLRKRKQEAQQADQAKSIFIANLSHEIRTPLNAIIGFIEQLSKSELNKDQVHMLSIIQKASDHLLYLVNEVVFLFKLGMGKVYVERVPFMVNEMLDELYSMMLPRATEKNLKFSLISSDCPETIIGDPYRIKQIIMNLLANAIKFTDAGEVNLRCQYKIKKKNMIEITFKISDTGPGIAKEDLPNIFDVFEQGSVLTQHSKSGAGLGLGICQRLTTLLDGEISVKSKLKQGSEFTVKLPFEIFTGDMKVSKAKSFPIEEELLAGKRILFADDDEHNLLLGEMILKNWGVKYVLVNNGCEALEALSTASFDLLLLDIQMPCKNGMEVISTIRKTQDHLNQLTPAISLSANILKSDINKYLNAGFNDYLIKPYKEEELYNKLCSVLYHKVSIPFKNQLYVEPPPSLKIDLSELLRTARGDKTFVKNMILNFVNQATALLDTFSQSSVDQNWIISGEKAHKAIPAFRYFGLSIIVESLRIIETNILRSYQPQIAALEVKRVEKRIRQAIVKAKKIINDM